jgi:hypothetical protein
VEPAAVELDVHGEISGVQVRGRVDVLDVEGRLKRAEESRVPELERKIGQQAMEIDFLNVMLIEAARFG